jgi:hypothetical protein
MTTKRQKKYLEIDTIKPCNEIISEIRRRADLQEKNKTLLIWELIDYRKFVINDNLIQIKRSPSLFNPFKSNGLLTIELQSSKDGTKINCLIDPYFENVLVGIAFFSLFSLVITILVIITLRKSPLYMILFIILSWIIPLGGIYIGHKINLLRLETYLDSILIDLELKK